MINALQCICGAILQPGVGVISMDDCTKHLNEHFVRRGHGAAKMKRDAF